ncbi:hypothetical protein RIF29_00687 [Crotalaria pallida]|uniref:Uncharacterized protein n=1 Tax=Crotalaria pallida TaxID=3830 RepID=A0AAN9IVV2_CROPI
MRSLGSDEVGGSKRDGVFRHLCIYCKKYDVERSKDNNFATVGGEVEIVAFASLPRIIIKNQSGNIDVVLAEDGKAVLRKCHLAEIVRWDPWLLDIPVLVVYLSSDEFFLVVEVHVACIYGYSIPVIYVHDFCAP